MLCNEVNQLFVHICPLTLGPLTPSPIPPTSVITGHRAELLELYSKLPLAICFTHGIIYIYYYVSSSLLFHSFPAPCSHLPSLCLHSCSLPANRFICTMFLDSAAVFLKSSAGRFIVQSSLRSLPRPHPVPINPLFLGWGPDIWMFVTLLGNFNVHPR